MQGTQKSKGQTGAGLNERGSLGQTGREESDEACGINRAHFIAGKPIRRAPKRGTARKWSCFPPSGTKSRYK